MDIHMRIDTDYVIDFTGKCHCISSAHRRS